VTHALPEAVLWDLDGTLVDTEPLWIAAEQELVTSHGGTWTHEDALTLVGKALPDSAGILIARGVAMTPAEVVDHLVARVNDRVASQGPHWRPGARELVAEVARAGVPQAIVTMSYRVQADLIASLLPEGAIGVVVSGDEVTRGKPDPEAYLTAADLLGVDIAGCIAVEDSVTGSAAAAASGARAVVVPHLVDVPSHPALARAETLAGLSLAGLVELAATATPLARAGA